MNLSTLLKPLSILSLAFLVGCVTYPEFNTPTYYDPNQKTSGFETIKVNEKTTLVNYYADPVYSLEEAENSWMNYSEKYCDTDHHEARITSSGYSEYKVLKTNYTTPTDGVICPVSGETEILGCLLAEGIISVLSSPYKSSKHSFPLVRGLVSCN